MTLTSDGPLATNHAGWNVQCLGNSGWFSMHASTGPLEDKDDAKILLKHFQEEHPNEEFRLYEAVHYPPLKK